MKFFHFCVTWVNISSIVRLMFKGKAPATDCRGSAGVAAADGGLAVSAVVDFTSSCPGLRPSGFRLPVARLVQSAFARLQR